MMDKTEAERVEAAIEEGVDLVGQGDSPVVAADYVAEKYSLEHRGVDLYEAIVAEVDDDEVR